MGSGGPRGLQNRLRGGHSVLGGFDSHALPPALLRMGRGKARMDRRLRRFVFVLLLGAGLIAAGRRPAASQVLLQGFYWDVPSPAAGNTSAPWWWDHLAHQANTLASYGFSAVWIPPELKSNSGGYSDGY